MLAYRYDSYAPDMTEGGIDLDKIEGTIKDVSASNENLRKNVITRGKVGFAAGGVSVKGSAVAEKLVDVQIDVEQQPLLGFGAATGLSEAVVSAYPQGVSALFSIFGTSAHSRMDGDTMWLSDLGGRSGIADACVQTKATAGSIEMSVDMPNRVVGTPGEKLFEPENLALFMSFLAGTVARRPDDL